MSNRRYGPCACGDRCSLNGVQADSQHICPWCEGLLHGFCGEASAQYGPHGNKEKDLAGLLWGRVCFNCAEKRKAELAGSSTARVTGRTSACTGSTADRTFATSTGLIASRRPTPAEEATARAAQRQRSKARREQRRRENDEAESSFASHEIPRPRNPEDEAAVAASFLLTASTNSAPHRGYGPSSRMDSSAAIHINQQRRDAASEPSRAAAASAASAAAPAAVAAAASATTGGGGMLVEPVGGLIPDAGMHAGVQGPSMRLVADAMYTQRLQHEKNRPKRTQGTYGPFFEKYWKPFCDAKDGDVIDGVTISGKGDDKWDYLVTPDKTYMFMSLYALKRDKRRGGDGTRSKKSVRNDLAKIVDLYQKQKVTPQFMAVMSRISHPRKDNELLKQLLASYDYGEKERRDEAILEESGVSLCDGEYYTRDQHRQVLSFGLLKEGGNPAAIQCSEIELAKMRLYHICGHNYLIRSEGRAVIKLRDLHMLEGPEGEGDQPMDIVVAHQDRSKTNQTGNLKRHGAARHRNEPFYDLGFQLGIYLYFRLVVDDKVPDFTDEGGVRKWMEELLFHTSGGPSSEMDSGSANNLLNKAYLNVVPPIKQYHVSHLGRKTGAREADLDGLPESDILRQGCWLDQNTMFRSYIVGIPMRIVRWRAGHGKDKGLYHVKRDNVLPPPGMVERVWPFLQSLRDLQTRTYSQWRQEFIELLEYLGKILLQDVAVLHDSLACSIVSCDPFNTCEYQEYRKELLESISGDASPDPANFRHVSLELHDIKSAVEEMKALLADVLQGRARQQFPRTAPSGSIRDYAVRRQSTTASASSLVQPIRRQQRAVHVPVQVDAAPVRQSASQLSVSSVYQNPNDTSTWRPRRPELPPFAANYEFLQYTSIKDLLEEYLVGSRGRPALKDIEKYFGPKKRGKSGKFPSWRSRSLRGSKKYDKKFCLNKNIYDLIDENKTIEQTVEQFQQIVHENNPEMMQGKNPINGKLVQWLIKYLQQNKEGYGERRGRANAAHLTKKRKREEMAQQQAQQQGGGQEQVHM